MLRKTLTLVLGLLSLAIGIGAGTLMTPSAADTIHKIASAFGLVVSPIAWPAVVLAFILLFPEQVAGLTIRLKKFVGVEFDPPPFAQAPKPEGDVLQPGPAQPPPVDPIREAAPAAAQGVAPTTPTASPIDVPLGRLMHIRTPAVVEAERAINRLELLNGLSPEERPRALLTIAGRLMVITQFEGAEGQIYASQIAMLEYLKSQPSPVSRDQLRSLFYEPAAAKDPKLFMDSTFERYVGFLKSFNLLVETGEAIQITTLGTEYLQWRTAMSKPPRLVG